MVSERASEPQRQPVELLCVLLAGAVKPSPLVEAAAVSVLDLHVTEQERVFDRWMNRLSATQRAMNGAINRVEALVALNDQAPSPRIEAAGKIAVKVVTDTSSYRGPAGAASDAVAAHGAAQVVLIAEASRWVDFDLAEPLGAHFASGADVTVVRNGDRTPAGVYIVERHCLESIQRRGFVDLKEQWLPTMLERGGDVRVHTIQQGASLPLRTAEHLLAAARDVSPRGAARSDSGGGAGPPWASISERAHVHESAIVTESLVMPEAIIGAGAVVIRSVVCRGARVPSAVRAVDRVIGLNRPIAGMTQ